MVAQLVMPLAALVRKDFNYGKLAIKENDFLDGCHYAAGAHADDFVTADNRLIGILEECPPPKPNVLHFDEWLDRVLTTRIPEAAAVNSTPL